MSLLHILKAQTVWELWPAQAFGFMQDKYIIEKVRVLLHATRLLVPMPLQGCESFVVKNLRSFIPHS